MSKVAILQSNYIPWKGYFDLISKSDFFVIYDEVQYTKNDWRNRNLIKTPKGLQWLTIPVQQENLQQKIFETKVVMNNWQRKHKSSLQVNYSKAMYFKNFKDEIFNQYDIKSNLLSDINISFIRCICSILEIDTTIIDSRELVLSGDRNSRLLEACKKLNARTYISGPSAKNYLNIHLFEQQGINIEWMDYTGYNEYSQLYPPFAHNVSILDLIFNMGAQTKDYLKK